MVSGVEWSEDCPVAGDSEMTDDSSRPATSASSEQRKPLSPAAERALAEAEVRRRAEAANARPEAQGCRAGRERAPARKRRGGDEPRRQTPGLRQRNPEVRRARSPRVMATGKTGASPRI